jgi:hypothetical protein
MPNTTANNECDTNADTCCLGTNFIILNYTNRTSDVYAYDKSYKPQEGVPIVAGGTAYDDTTTGTTYILVFHEALYYGTKLDHSLINPNQIRSYGIPFWDNPFNLNMRLRIDVNDELQTPMRTKGTKVLFSTRTPTARELSECPYIIMTSPAAWNPQDVTINEASAIPIATLPFYRESYISRVGSIRSYEYLDSTSDEALLHSIHPVLANLKELMTQRSIAKTTTYDRDLEDTPSRRTFVSTNRHSNITADHVAERFGIGTERAKATLRATTQRGMRSAILPIGRRYQADRMFQVRRLKGKFATDTLCATTKSLNSNAATQIYTHKCGFNATYHLTRANGEQVGYSLSDFVHEC